MPIPVAPHPLDPETIIASARVFRRAVAGCGLEDGAGDAAYWACLWRAVEAHAAEGVSVPWFVLLALAHAPEPWQSRSREAFGLPAVGEREDFDTEDNELAQAFADYLFDSLAGLTSAGASQRRWGPYWTRSSGRTRGRARRCPRGWDTRGSTCRRAPCAEEGERGTAYAPSPASFLPRRFRLGFSGTPPGGIGVRIILPAASSQSPSITRRGSGGPGFFLSFGLSGRRASLPRHVL